MQRAPTREEVDLKVVHRTESELRALYGADFALIRPDQIVAWRGNNAAAARRALEQLRG